jgi:uncharacterized membrane protein (UPF0127 family)
MKRVFVVLLAALVLGGAAFAQVLEPVQVVSGGKSHTFSVEIADEDAEREQGLMNRDSMARDRGMLFLYPELSRTGVWMKNTRISLDLLFLAEDGKVLAIARKARPGSLRIIDPGVRVKGFLEINGGQAEELGIKPGDVVQHRAFGNVNAGGG